MLFNFNNEERNYVFIALIKSQGDILEKLKNTRSDKFSKVYKKKLVKEYNNLEQIAKTIQRSFD